MALEDFVGNWEIIFCCYLSKDDAILEGVKFRLDDNGDVTWHVRDELKSVPLFTCETYEIYYTCVLGVVMRFGAYAGHVIEFKCTNADVKDILVMTCDNWCVLHCKRLREQKIRKPISLPFSLLPALEGYFSDVILKSSNRKEFNVHSTILKLQGYDIDWDSDPQPFNDLSEEVLGTILHYFYAECLPEKLDIDTTKKVLAVATRYDSLKRLVQLCEIYLKNVKLEQQIVGLVDDMHKSMNQMTEHFLIKSDNLISNPGKLCFAVKQCIRDACVVGAKLVQLCDLFTKRKGELTREQRHEIIRFAKSHLPLFSMQLHRFVQTLRSTFGAMTAAQRMEVAGFLVPEIEVILDTISSLIAHVEVALQQIIQVLSPYDLKQSNAIGKSLRKVLHVKELSKLRLLHEHVSTSLNLLILKKENFNELSSAQKVRSIATNLEQLINELPIFLLKLEEVTAAFDEKLEWKEFKFCFKVGTSKISGILQKSVAHRVMLQKLMMQLCELVQRDAFTKALQELELLESNPILNDGENGIDEKEDERNRLRNLDFAGNKLNLIESLSIPPLAKNSRLSYSLSNLLEKEIDTDMKFEILSNTNDENKVETHPQTIIKAHRVIIAARCDWFRRALLSGMREAIDRKITIHDTNPTLFRLFLEYLYGGRLREENLSIEQSVELLLLADRYEVDSLKQTCEYGLQTSIDHDSVLYFLSMADQYNARILRKSCLNFISQHQELTESEVFFELPISLQAEIFDCVWTQTPPRRSDTMDKLLGSSPDSSCTDSKKNGAGCHVDHQRSNSDSFEDLRLVDASDSCRLDACFEQLRDIVGDTASREQLIQVILAADYDLCRAINFYYAKQNDDE